MGVSFDEVVCGDAQKFFEHHWLWGGAGSYNLGKPSIIVCDVGKQLFNVGSGRGAEYCSVFQVVIEQQPLRKQEHFPERYPSYVKPGAFSMSSDKIGMWGT